MESSFTCMKGDGVDCSDLEKPPTTQVECENEKCSAGKTCDEDIDCAGNMVCKKDDGKKFGKCHLPKFNLEWSDCDRTCGFGTQFSRYVCDTGKISDCSFK